MFEFAKQTPFQQAVPSRRTESPPSRASRPYSSLQTPFQQAVTSRRTESPLSRAWSPYRRPNHPPWPTPPIPPQRRRIFQRAIPFQPFTSITTGETE
jgi:hypothetical protein